MNPQHPAKSAGADRLTRLESYLSQDPGNDLLRAETFDAALQAGDVARAEAILLARTADSAHWLLRCASLLMAQGRYADAAQRVEPAVADAIPEDPTQLAMVLTWLRAAHQSGELDTAWQWLQGRLKEGAVSSEVAAIGSLLALDADDIHAAEALADVALAAYPQSREALVAKGTAMLMRRNAGAALELATRVLAQKDDGRARSLAAFSEMLAGRAPAALDHFAKAVAQMPSHVGTWLGYGWLRLLTGDRQGARAAFETALALDRAFGDNHGSLAVIEALEGHADRARRLADVAFRLMPGCASAQYALAILNGDAQDPKKMRTLAESIVAGG